MIVLHSGGWKWIWLIAACCAGSASCGKAEQPPANAAAPPADSTISPSDVDAKTAYAILKKYCHRCHGVNDEVGNGFRVLDRDSLLAQRMGERLSYITPGDPEKSLVWVKAVLEKSMPPSYAERGEFPFPTDAERAQLGFWIAAGAPLPETTSRSFVGEKEMLAAVVEDLQKQKEEDRQFRRYFSLLPVHNNQEISSDQLALLRAAVSKLINSLSWSEKIVVPVSCGPENTLLAIDLRDYGWTHEVQWRLISQNYPYGVKFGEDKAWLSRQETTRSLTGGAYFPVVRADWFVSAMSRSPFYEQLLELPDSLEKLESLLKVDSADNFEHGNLIRAGVIASHVSRNNRAAERHETPNGAYWRSFDFQTSDERANILRFPLGPMFSGNPFSDRAFVPAGGEIIFSLPNGLQAYLLVDQNGRRLKGPAPISIVRDLSEAAGTPEIVNGLSCIACHSRGMKPLADVVRESQSVFGRDLEKVKQLYAPQEKIDQILAQDEARFLKAATAAIEPFLGAEGASVNVVSFEEPISAVAREFAKEITLHTAAAELGMRNPSELEALVKNNVDLQKLGLGVLLKSKSIKRELWERRGVSVFELVNHQLRRTPDREL